MLKEPRAVSPVKVVKIFPLLKGTLKRLIKKKLTMSKKTKKNEKTNKSSRNNAEN